MAEGVARVVHSVEELETLVDGEILVCPLTAPSWSIVFARIAAAVSDGGGIMSHAAIVSREYELPAVVATGVGTKVAAHRRPAAGGRQHRRRDHPRAAAGDAVSVAGGDATGGG